MKETIICANCGIEHPLDIMYQVEGDGLCEDCFDACHVRCDDCGRILRRDNAYWGDAVNAICNGACNFC